jgi:hypothetical protein
VVAPRARGAGNEPLIGLPPRRRRSTEDHDLYLAGFAQNSASCVRLLLKRTPNGSDVARMALAAPISKGDAEALRTGDTACSAAT